MADPWGLPKLVDENGPYLGLGSAPQLPSGGPGKQRPRHWRTHEQTHRSWSRRNRRGSCLPVFTSTAPPPRYCFHPSYAPAYGGHDGESSRTVATETGHVRSATSTRPERSNYRDAAGAERAPARATATAALICAACARGTRARETAVASAVEMSAWVGQVRPSTTKRFVVRWEELNLLIDHLVFAQF